jgi:osmotically-inducible protein OsmY
MRLLIGDMLLRGVILAMKKFLNLFAFSLALIAFSFVGINAQNVSPTTLEIAKKVEKSIKKLPRYEVFDYIDFTVDGSVVTLTGKVRNAINKSDAEGYVKKVAGVTSVINKIELLPVGSFDDTIRRDLYATLSRSGGLSRYLWTVNPDVRLIVERGHITLEGSVYNQGDYNQMNIMARSVPGAFSVTNNLTVGSTDAR